ncbi:MAG: hypothetical protein ACRCYV_10175 [Aeromonas sp.]
MRLSFTASQAKQLILSLEAARNACPTAQCQYWLAYELRGYPLEVQLPWYRILLCRQRGHFIDLASGKHLMCPINDCALTRADLAQVQYFYAREPAAAYLLKRTPTLEHWPSQLLRIYQESLIPGRRCLQAWREPMESLPRQLMLGLAQFIAAQQKDATLFEQRQHKTLRRKQWHI